MDRTRAADHLVHTSGRRIYEDRDLAQGKLGTQTEQADRNGIQEELMAVIEHGQAIGAKNLADQTSLVPLDFDIDTPKTYQQLLSVILHLVDQSIPAGTVAGTFRDAPPTGWLECDGAEISRATYSVLFNAIGTKFGTGDGSTTFNLPDLRGQFLRGWDHGAEVDPDAASRTDRGDGAGGDTVGSRQGDEFKSHNHQISPKIGAFVNNGAPGGDMDRKDGGTTGDTGGNETRPKNVYTIWVIKT